MPSRTYRPAPLPSGLSALTTSDHSRDIGSVRDLTRPSATDLLAAYPDVGGHQRVTCEHADRCGGCPIIGLSYGEQLAMKRGRVVQSATRYPTLELVYTEPVAAADPIVAYRTRAKLIVASRGMLGLYAKGGGHHVVDIPNCRVLTPELSTVAAVLRARIAIDEGKGGPFAPAETGGALRALDLRELRTDDGARVLVTLVMQRGRVAPKDVLEQAAQSLADAAPSIIGVAVSIHDGESAQILGTEAVVVYGRAIVEDQVGLSRHQATFGSFVQAHRGQAERVQATLIELLGVRDSRDAGEDTRARQRVLDLYGGAGGIALALARAGADVHLVESGAAAAAHADETARRSGLPVRTEASDVASALRRLAEQKTRFDAVVMNPPRRGMSPLARELVSRLDVTTLAYVSCDPDTLMRDLDHLTRLGFAVSTLRPLDMIPLTDEVETIAVLRRVGVPAPKVLYEDDEILVVEKGSHEPTIPQSEYASSLVQRARSLPTASEAAPVNRLDVGTSGLIMLAKRPEDVAKWQEVMEKESARRIYVAGVRGVTPSKGAIARELREDGKMYPARTRYRRLAVASGHSVLRIVPEQTRAHQIRRHLAAIGHGLLGDDRYGHAPTNRFFEEKNALDRTFLHCVRLEFDHPTLGQRMIVEAAMPGDLRAVLDRTSGPATLRFLEHKNALGTRGGSSFPPPPDSSVDSSRDFTNLPPDSQDIHDRPSLLDVDSSRPSLHSELAGDINAREPDGSSL